MLNHKTKLDPYGLTAGRTHMTGKPPRPKTVTVDLHNHMRVGRAAELVKPHLPKDFHPAHAIASKLTAEVNARQDADRQVEFSNIDRRVEDMDKMDLDVMAVSCAPMQFYYAVEAKIGAESSRIVNDGIAEAVAKHPKRLTGLGTVPLQDTDLALKELDRLTGELKFHGIQIGARVRDEELSAKRLEPFWKRCEELDLLIFIHPSSFNSPRFSQHYLLNIVGNPLDTSVAMHYLIFDGVMARYPKIKFYLSHGGAFPAAYAARMDHAYGSRADCREHIDELPSTYLKKFYFDTIVFSVPQLKFLIEQYGVDHMSIGTDYPADMGEYRPVEHVYQVPGLSEADREKICGLNALGLLNLKESDFKR